MISQCRLSPVEQVQLHLGGSCKSTDICMMLPHFLREDVMEGIRGVETRPRRMKTSGVRFNSA